MVSANHWAKPKDVAPSAPPRRSRERSSGKAWARAQMSAMPSKRPQVTKAPTAMKATSLTTNSKATAATMPSCRSALSRWRVPNIMVNAASASATKSVPSRHQAGVAAAGAAGPAVRRW